MRASQFFRTGTGHRAERRPLASSNTPASRIPCGERFFDASYGRSLSLRPSRLFASLSDRTRGTSSSQPTEAFTSPLPDAGSPRHPWGYDYDAKLRIAPAGLPPASSAASLAAPAPRTTSDRFRQRTNEAIRRAQPAARRRVNFNLRRRSVVWPDQTQPESNCGMPPDNPVSVRGAVFIGTSSNVYRVPDRRARQ